jgi:hypothetical protein
MKREDLHRLTLRVLAVSFAAVGTTFAVAPEATIRALDAAGAAFGDFEPAPAAGASLWLSLTAGYMVLVTLLAWMAQRDLRRYRHLIALLAAGKATSSLTSLLFYAVSVPAFPMLANFVVDGGITLVALAIWADVPRLPGERVPGGAATAGPAAARPALTALLEALAPPGGPFPEGAGTAAVATGVGDLVAAADRARAFGLLLRALDLSPFVLPPLRFRRFSRLPLGERIRVLDAWERSRLWPRRQAFHMLKLVGAGHFYSRPEIQARLGYPPPLWRVPPGNGPGQATS